MFCKLLIFINAICEDDKRVSVDTHRFDPPFRPCFEMVENKGGSKRSVSTGGFLKHDLTIDICEMTPMKRTFLCFVLFWPPLHTPPKKNPPAAGWKKLWNDPDFLCFVLFWPLPTYPPKNAEIGSLHFLELSIYLWMRHEEIPKLHDDIQSWNKGIRGQDGHELKVFKSIWSDYRDSGSKIQTQTNSQEAPKYQGSSMSLPPPCVRSSRRRREIFGGCLVNFEFPPLVFDLWKQGGGQTHGTPLMSEVDDAQRFLF